MGVQQRTVIVGGAVRPYRLRRSQRAKHLLLHVDVSGEIEVVVPWQVAFGEAEEFVHEKRVWLERALGDFTRRRRERPKRSFKTGEVLPLLGEQYSLRVVCDARRKRSSWGEERGEISVFVARRGDVRGALTRWYKRRARQYFEEKVWSMAKQLGVSVRALAVSDARSQWGSCIQSTGRISLHWRLLLGPVGVTDYVIAHEVAHLKERGHTAMFWRLTERLDPYCAQHRVWLRRNGHRLVL